MNKYFNKNNILTAAAFICFISIVLILSDVIHIKGRKKLTLGVFVGNCWDVPDSDSYKIIDDAIEEFKKNHSDVEIEYTSGILKEDYSEWLYEEILKGDAPDVFFILPEDFVYLASVGALANIEGLIKNDTAFDSSDYYPASYEYGEYMGTQYALPYQSVPNMMFVNKTLLENAGIAIPDSDWTWEDFYEICRKVTKDTTGSGTYDSFGVFDYGWEEALLTNGADIFNSDGTQCDLSNENVKEAVNFVKSLYNLNDGYQVTSADFDMGRVAFMPVSLAEYRTYKPYPWRIKKYSNFEWECITLPRGPNGENKSKLSTMLMGINSRTSQKSLSWELLKDFAYNDKIQMEIFENQPGASVLKSITSSQEADELINRDMPEDSRVNTQLISDIMENAVTEKNSKKTEEARAVIDAGITDIITNNKNADVALVALQRAVNKILKE